MKGRSFIVSDMQDRIAEVVGQHFPCPCGRDIDDFPHCVCGWYDDDHNQPWRAHVAAVVVSELGLTGRWSSIRAFIYALTEEAMDLVTGRRRRDK